MAEAGRSGLLRFLAVCFLLAVLAALASVAFYSLFGNFRSYDDEGVLLMGSRLFLSGINFYIDMPWIYGPGHLAGIRILHDWMAIPLTNSAVRFITMAYWLALSSCSGLLVYTITRSFGWSVVGLVLVFGYTASIVNEPGHPQGLIALATVAIVLLAGRIEEHRALLRWLLIGAAVAAVLHTKVNAGLFCAAAVSVVFIGGLRRSSWHRFIGPALVIGSGVFPFVLMFPLLDEPGCLIFACLAAMGMIAVALVVIQTQEPMRELGSSVLAFLGGFCLVTSAALIFAALNGASIVDIVESLLGYAGAQQHYYHYFRAYSVYQMCSAVVALVLAVCWAYSYNLRTKKRIEVFGKIYFVGAAIYALIIDGPGTAQSMFGYAGPWCWLVAISEPGRLARRLLAAIAVWSVLLAYPIPGSQIYFGGFCILLSAIICLVDLCLVAEQKWALNNRVREPGPANVMVVVAVLAALGSLSLDWQHARKQYLSFVPLGLPGTQWIRIERGRGKTYRNLVDELNAADMALTTFRFNSLYLWSTVSMPGLLYHAHDVSYASAAQTALIRADLERAERPVIVTREVASWGGPLPETEFQDWIDANFEGYRKIGKYTLLKPRASFSVRQENE